MPSLKMKLFTAVLFYAVMMVGVVTEGHAEGNNTTTATKIYLVEVHQNYGGDTQSVACEANQICSVEIKLISNKDYYTKLETDIIFSDKKALFKFKSNGWADNLYVSQSYYTVGKKYFEMALGDSNGLHQKLFLFQPPTILSPDPPLL